MISLEEYGVITRLDFHTSDPDSRAQYLKNNADLVGKQNMLVSVNQNIFID